MSGKDLSTQSSVSGQTSGEVSWDRLSRRVTNTASGKPLPTPSFPMQTTTSGKPRLLSRRHVLRRESLPRQALPCSFVKEPFYRHYTESSRKALEKIEKRRLAASYERRKAEDEVAVAATDDNEDGRDNGELRTVTVCPDALLAFSDAHLRCRENLGLGNIPYFPREAFPNALLMASEKPKPFPTHTYGVGKTYALGIPLISHVRLVPTHYLRRREYPLFSDVLCPTHELCVGKTSYSRRLTLCVGRTSYSRPTSAHVCSVLEAAPTPFFASRLPAEPRLPSAASRADTCPQAEPISTFPTEPPSPFKPPSFCGSFPYLSLGRLDQVELERGISRLKGNYCNLDLGASLLGKRILLLLEFDRANLQPIKVVPAWVFFRITTDLELRNPTGRQSSMDIDMIRVIRRDPRSPIVLVFPPGSLQTSRGRGKGKGKLASDQK
ncbi:uncharacterized protein E5676_scaffold1923G00020 [Cucumis melo var. makuwa]|uniref:Uncharacterized protein n=1 Tax=Cucumis melo var. makuwa TaxID=1194695 RepID=A0A5D3BM25_CUCMM|nr:uncharacterized protein E5676_scaffold1923G00020 [Cucumis melo var. makuwa]